MPAILFLVGTPIGNTEDITLRALRVLTQVDLVAAEDTRRTRLLLHHHGINKPVVSYHEHNETHRCKELLECLQRGQSVALVSDAGMPAISDPGQRLLQTAVANHIPVQVVPGPSAATMSVVMAGLGDGRYLFYGFPPHRASHRKKVFAQLAPLPFTLVFFESPYRVVASISDMLKTFGRRRAVLCRELTKKFEEVIRGHLDELHQTLTRRRLKGEITIVVEGASQ
ncbi:MAG: 16S rRNA (cytidine(1402)-2'-O)-methyltransferase [Verrucomicrobiae bacterium]|nr:16S rRNA (cytidine(1402)-2'-O)-methyltransferase [Verrucomicrobiae bacterium]